MAAVVRNVQLGQASMNPPDLCLQAAMPGKLKFPPTWNSQVPPHFKQLYKVLYFCSQKKMTEKRTFCENFLAAFFYFYLHTI